MVIGSRHFLEEDERGLLHLYIKDTSFVRRGFYAFVIGARQKAFGDDFIKDEIRNAKEVLFETSKKWD